jgi:hypothetical protein
MTPGPCPGRGLADVKFIVIVPVNRGRGQDPDFAWPSGGCLSMNHQLPGVLPAESPGPGREEARASDRARGSPGTAPRRTSRAATVTSLTAGDARGSWGEVWGSLPSMPLQREGCSRSTMARQNGASHMCWPGANRRATSSNAELSASIELEGRQRAALSAQTPP